LRIRTITISKLGHDRRVIFSWQGLVVEQDEQQLLVHAHWERSEPLFLGYTVFEPGDLFVETYFTQRWFSIWEIRSQRNHRTKGWYCNICRPIELDGDQLRFEDMELDLFVFPDGRFVLLDEEDLLRADLSPADVEQARAGLREVTSWILTRQPPFDRIGPPRAIEPFWDLPPTPPPIP